MAQYQVGRSVYELPDDLDNATLNATLQQLAEQEAMRPRDGALAYSADQAQRLIGRAGQTVGTAFGIDSLEEAGRQYAAEQEQDIQQGGYQTSIQDSGFIEAVQNGRGMSYVGTMIAENGVGTAATLGLGAAAGVAGVLAMPVTAAVLGGTALAAGIGMGIGEATEVAEQAGVDTSTQGSAIANVAVGTIAGLLERIGAKGVVPTEQLARMSVGEVADKLVEKGKTSAAKKFLKTVASGAVSEGTTEMTQSALMLNNAMLQGGEFTTDELVNDLVDSFVVGAATGAGATTGISGVAGAANALKTGGGLEVGDAQAAADFAKRLEGIADANGYDLNDIDKGSTVGARETVDKAHIQMSEELKSLFADLKTRVKPTDADDFDTLSDKILAAAAYREGRNKTKSTVGKQELDALDRLAGDTKEGQDAAALLRQMNEMTRLHNDGYQGGVSQYTDQLAPFGSKVGYDKGAIATERILRPLTSGGLALQTGGTSLAAQAGIQAGGRVIDKITGKRSKVKNYIEQNVGNEGIPASTGQSLRLQKQAEVAQEEADAQAEAQRRGDLNEALYQAGAPAKEDSPQGTMQQGVPLPIEDILAAMPEVVRQFPQLEQAAADFERSVVRGGKVQDLTELIRATKAVTGVDGDAMRRAEQIEAGQAVRTLGVNYERGVESNRQFANELRDGINDDKTISPADKAVMLTALDDFGRNLGKNPAEAIQAKMKDIYERVGDKDAAMNYLMPYVERVMAQQDAKSQIDDFIGQLRDDNLFSDPDTTETPQFAGGNPDAPLLEQVVDVFGIGDLMALTNLGIRPSQADVAAMRDGSYRAAKRRKKEAAAQLLQDRWQEATGRNAPFAYFDENIDLIASLMATEAYQNIQEDGNAIGWYDRKLKAAKAIVSLVDPRVTETYENEAAFDFALAVTSNGAAVTDNFANALEVFRSYMDTGRMPSDSWIKGGERNEAMVRSFEFFNAYEAAQVETPISEFLSTDFSVGELKEWAAQFNEQHGTDLSLPSHEGVNVEVKGSYILGAKIGQGFYQNLRGNFDPLTMDIWWMRMWNRLIGSPYENAKNLDDGRARIGGLMKGATGLEQKLINQTLKERSETRTMLKNDQDRFDDFIVDLDKRYQRFYKQYKKDNGVNHDKPELFKATGTQVRNMTPQLQATPRNASERQYMRDVVNAAREKLASVGYDINTADFQALMWYPEKQLFRHLGVAAGRGADNDYQDAAEILAKKEGISDDQIQEALAAAGADGAVVGGANPIQQDAGRDSQLRQINPAQEGILPDLTEQGQLFLEEEIASTKEVLGEPELPIRAPTPTEIKTQEPTVKAFFEVGKEGSPYENGMNADDVNNLGLMLGYMIVDAPNKAKMGDIVRRKIRSNEHYAGVNMVYTNASVPHTIGLLAEGYVNPKDPENQNVSSLDYLFTKAHEIVGHALENRPFGFEYLNQQDTTGERINPNRSGYMVIEQSINAPEGGIYPDGRTLEQGETDLVDVDDVNRSDNAVLFQRGQQFTHQNNRDLPTIENPVTGQTESGRLDTIRGQLAKRLENLDTKDFDAKKVSKELIAFQKSRVSSSRNPELGSKRVRSAYTMYERGMAMGKRASAANYIATVQRNNIHKMAELLADGFAGYAVNPKEFKQNYPETAKMIRFFQNDPNNKSSKFIQFYAHPLPTVLAVALAMFGIAAGGGEERPPEGALSPSGGALTI